MIVRNLPPPDLFSVTATAVGTATATGAGKPAGIPAGTPLIFPDHMLFTETIVAPYSCPEHTPGMGILAMLSGSGRYTINRRKETLDQGHFLLLNQDSRLTVHLPRPGIQPLFLYFHTALAAELLNKKGVDWRWLERAHPLEENLRQRLQSLAAMRDNCSSFAALKADAMIRGILEELSITKEWIESHYTSPINLQQMAQIANLNSQHFLRMFRDCYGVTPHRFLMNVRLNAARLQIQNTPETISAICLQTGFESLPTFCRRFRQRFDASPTTYRRNHANNQKT
jgi:AraC family transcriptional regulator